MPSSEKTIQADGNNPTENKNNVGGLTLQTALDKISVAAGPAANYISTGAHAAGEALIAAAVKANDVLGAAGEQLNDMHERVTEDCRKYVRAKPMAAIGIALAAGFILSRLLSSGSKEE